MGAIIATFGSYLLLFFLVFGMSATVDVAHLRRQLRNGKALLTGVSLQFVILPFLGFAVVKLLRMNAPMGITLLVITSSPGGSYSNWWCSMFNADLALSVTMTAISTLLSVIMLPLNLILYATNSYSSAVVKSLDWYSLFVSLVVVIGAISTGLICSARNNSHQFNLTANKLGNLAGIALISFSVALSSSGNNANLWEQPWDFYFGVALPAVLGLAIATWMATKFQLAKPERVAVAVESCYQNTGIATSVAITMFNGEDLAVAVGVPLFYGICEAVLLAGFCLTAWKMGWTKAPADENFCVVIAKSYEVQEAELDDPDAIEVVLGSKDDDGTGDLHDLIFSQTGDGYQIDEESLNSLSNPQDTPYERSPTRSEENDDGHDIVKQDSNKPQATAIDEGDSDEENFAIERKPGRRKKYAALNVCSPTSHARPSPAVSPVSSTIVIPPLEYPETPPTRRPLDSTTKNVVRLGRAVTTLRARVQGYQKAVVVESLSPTSRESSSGCNSDALSADGTAWSPDDATTSTSRDIALSSVIPQEVPARDDDDDDPEERSPVAAVLQSDLQKRLPITGKSLD